MNSNTLKILVIDDEERIREEIGEFLSSQNFQVFEADLPSKALNILEEEQIDIIILDIKMPEMDGIALLGKIKQYYPDIEVIMISGHGDMQSVIHAMRNGASDFFPKPFRLTDIQLSIERTSRYLELNHRFKNLEKKYQLLSSEIADNTGHQIIGKSAAINHVLKMMEKVAKVENTTVLITGESGTGKEVVARGIHYLSSRNKQYFHSVNCSAIPETLFESEFFGHIKGSFTGADKNKAGWFEISNNGTLFLDEIGDMPISQQAKLLRVLEERKVSRIGSGEQIDVDVRVIAASNQALEEMSDNKEFRLDLYHRLSSFIIHIPPLRDRKEDIPLLLEHFVSYFSTMMGKHIADIDPAVTEALIQHDFPGNIRELKNLVERAMIIAEGKILKVSDFQLKPTLLPAENIVIKENDVFDLEQSEKNLIQKALVKTNNNKAQAAELLNITWQALNRRMKKFGL